MLKITVIVPVYNTEPYLRQCLDSILEQHFQNFEALLIDDASTDGSGAICDEYAAKDERFIVIRHDRNRGAAAARNTGLDNATGDFVYFLDSDLWIEPGCLTRLAKAIVEDKTDMAVCSYVTEYENKSRPNFFSYAPVGIWTIPRWVEHNAKADTDEADEKLWNRMFKRKIFADTRFDETNRYSAAALLPELTENCFNISCINRVLVHYRIKNEPVITDGTLLDKFTAYDRKRAIYIDHYPQYVWYVDRQAVRYCLSILRLRAIHGSCEALEAGLSDILDRLVMLSKQRKVCDLKLRLEVFTALKFPGLFSALARMKKK